MEPVDEIRENLACPGCDYNLRGLRGSVINCPECGRVCDVVEMIARRWTEPWFKAPGLSTLFGPCAWASIMGVFVMPFLLLAPFRMETRMIAAIVIFGIWFVLMWRAWAVFGSEEGLYLALLAHVILVGYVASVVAGIFAGFLVVIAAGSLFLPGGMFGDSPWSLAMALLGGIALGVGTFMVLSVFRRGERYIAQRCIRQYLNRPPRS